MTDLRLEQRVSLPAEAIAESVAVMGIKGSGKTYVSMLLAERAFDAGAQVVVIDPTDAWYGLRSSADGKHDGLPIYVFGGSHGDLPLEPTSGELIADVLVDSRANAVLSLRHMRKGDQHKFVTAFAERLYFRKGEPQHRTPLMLFVDEAHSFAPQRVMGEDARMVGAIEDIARMGRNCGLGMAVISQRPASVNKDVLTQCSILVCMRVMSSQDRKALDAWIEAFDVEGQRAEFMTTVATLATGEAWVWAPEHRIFTRARITGRRTFDSSATPRPGEQRVEPARRAMLDVERLGARILATVEEARERDPAELRKRIRALEAQVRAAEAHAETQVQHVEIPTFTPADSQVVESFREASANVLAGLNDLGDRIHAALGTVTDRLAIVNGHSEAKRLRPALPAAEVPPGARRRAEVGTQTVTLPRAPRAEPPADTSIKLFATERAILSVLAQFGERGRRYSQLSLLTGYSGKSSGFTNALSKLRTAGLIMGANPSLMTITEAGYEMVGTVDALPRGHDLLEHWAAKLDRCPRLILTYLYERHPRGASMQSIADGTGYSTTSSGFTNALSKLRTLELIEGSNGGTMHVSPTFFED